MNVRRALTFLFQDPKWGSVIGITMLFSVLPTVVTALSFQTFGSRVPPQLQAIAHSPLWFLLLVSVASIPILGYELRITRQVIHGDDLPLPLWSDISGILHDGIGLWVVVTSWSLLSLVIEYLTGSHNQEASFNVQTLISTLTGAILTLLIQPAAQGRLAATMSLRAGLNPAAVLGAIGDHLGRYLRLATAILLVAGIGGAIGVTLTLIAAFATGHYRERFALQATVELGIVLTLLLFMPYFRFVSSHLIGQVARDTSLP